MKNPILKIISEVYGAGVLLRNNYYDRGWKKEFEFDFPVIGVGNLSAGGTGKTPCVAWIVKNLLPEFSVGSLSRGYGRKTKGYLMGTSLSRVEDIGDEPKLLKRKFPKLEVAVGEQRVAAIPAMLEDEESLDVIVLDDCFQHRNLKPGLQILLTPYHRLYTEDDLLPLGRLREPAKGANRADIIIVTKCPDGLTKTQREKVEEKLKPLPEQRLYFSGLKYGDPYPLFPSEISKLPPATQPLVVTGIAWPEPMLETVASSWSDASHLRFPDHYPYGPLDFRKMRREIEKTDGPGFVLTTEKDAMRMEEWKEAIGDLPIFVLPVEMNLLDEESTDLLSHLRDFALSFENTAL